MLPCLLLLVQSKTKAKLNPLMNHPNKVTRYDRRFGGLIFGMEDPIGLAKGTGVINSIETTAANVDNISRAADLLHGEEQ